MSPPVVLRMACAVALMAGIVWDAVTPVCTASAAPTAAPPIAPPLPLATLATISVGDTPKAVAVDPFSHRVFVANTDSNSITELDANSLHVRSTTGLDAKPGAIAIDPALGLVFITQSNSFAGGTIAVLREATDQVTNIFLVAGSPSVLAVDDTNHVLFVGGAIENGLSVPEAVLQVIDVHALAQGTDPSNWQLVPVGNALGAGTSVTSMAVDAARQTVYVAIVHTGDAQLLQALNATSFKLLGATGSPQGVYAGEFMALDAERHRVLATSIDHGRLFILDATTPQDLTNRPLTVTGLAGPAGVAIDPSTGVAYVASSGMFSDPRAANNVTVVDETTGQVLATVPVGNVPWGVAVDPTTHRVFVANSGDGTVTVLQGLTAPASATPAALPTGGGGGMAGCTPG